MNKLKIEQSFFKRCLCCNNLNEYTLRAENVNTNITDVDIPRLASNNLGDTDGEWCENCNKMTAQMTVAYTMDES